MPFEKKINTPVGTIAIWKLGDSLEELNGLYTLNNSDEEKFGQLTAERRKKEFLASRILVENILGKNQEIYYHQSGKPFLKGSKINISISHSADFVSVFISEKKIGIDIEQTTRNIDRVATRFLHPKEQAFIKRLENQQLAKILFWSAKEAIFKCSDLQGIEFNKQIIIAPIDFNNSNKFEGTLQHSLKNVNYMLHYFLLENNVMVYCVEQ